MEEPQEYVDFMAKYKDWVAIRKIGIRADTRPEEVAFYLAGIRALADSKAFSILGINTAALDSFADTITQGSRKNYQALASALSKMGSPEQKRTVDSACSNKDMMPLADTYLLTKVITNVGYDLGASQPAMSKIWKDLKVQKGPGRRPKK